MRENAEQINLLYFPSSDQNLWSDIVAIFG